MAEGKSKIASEKVRLPDELMAELRRRAAEYLARGERAPTQGELLWQAWQRAEGEESDMAGSAGKSVKLPDELRAQLKEAAHQYWKETGVEVTFGELLWRAWRLQTDSPKGPVVSKLKLGDIQTSASSSTVTSGPEPTPSPGNPTHHEQQPRLHTATATSPPESVELARLLHDAIVRLEKTVGGLAASRDPKPATKRPPKDRGKPRKGAA